MTIYRQLIWLGIIGFLYASTLFISLPIDHPQWALNILRWQPEESRDLSIKQGLDLRGGIQVLLEAEPAAGQVLSEEDLEATKVVITNRVNALGVVEPVVQIQGDRRIIVELPGIDNPDLAIQTLRSTGQLEFVDIDLPPQQAFVPQGAFLRTSLERDRRIEAGEEPEIPLRRKLRPILLLLIPTLTGCSVPL